MKRGVGQQPGVLLEDLLGPAAGEPGPAGLRAHVEPKHGNLDAYPWQAAIDTLPA
ncbi:hypothetical protein ACIA6D_41355 [Streptomyces cacaoi]|uniref:hypothetical protein n=1 Tax=Streptomyces cacaoi TaxID=1898 RepID=UPI003747EDBA